MIRLLFAAFYLAIYLVLSSSASPLFVVFGTYWQLVAGFSGLVFCIALVVIGWRSERRARVLHSALWARRGQILVELAVALPFLLFVLLGAVESGFLLITKADQDHRTVTIAEWAADHPGQSWNSVAEYELKGCDVTMTTPRPDLLEMKTTCQYHPVVLVMWDGLPISSEAQAAVESSASPSPSPDASPFSSSTTRPGRPPA